jgi:uncharacterized protein YqjF (DUF2071 family)
MLAQETLAEPRADSGITPPPGPWLWSQSWRDLLFCHWKMPAHLVQPHLPASLEVDTYSGNAWISAVAFRLTGVRRRWLPAVPPCSGFAELNLRTYVLHRGEPAIYFLSIHAGKRGAVRLARRFTPLPYRFAHMTYAREPDRFHFHSASLDGISFDASFVPVNAGHEASPGSLDAWLLERYCLYVADGYRPLVRTVVQHRPWQFGVPLVRIGAHSLGCPFGLDLSRPPDVTHFSPGVHALVWPFTRFL